MKVILLQDVAKIGRRSAVVEVPDGYALNQLIPKKMAQPATPANMKRIEKMQAETAASSEAEKAQFVAAKAILDAQKVQVSAEVNEQGHTFKAVSEQDIAAAAVAAGAAVEATMIVVATPIKEIGEHVVTLSHGGETATFTIEVVKK